MIGSFCTLVGVTVWAFATIENGVQKIKYFDIDGVEYELADIEPKVCPPANPFNVVFEFGSSFVCAGGTSLQGDIAITLDNVGGIIDNSVFNLVFSVAGCQLISSDANIVVDDINVTAFRVVDAGALTNPIALEVRIPSINDCATRDSNYTASVDVISPTLHGWVLVGSTPDTLNYVHP